MKSLRTLRFLIPAAVLFASVGCLPTATLVDNAVAAPLHVDSSDAAIQDLRERNARLRTRLNALEAEQQRTAEELAAARRSMSAQDQQIRVLQADNDRQRAQVIAMRAELQQRDAKIAELDEAVRSSGDGAVAERLQQRIARLQRRLEEQRALAAQAEDLRQALHVQEAEVVRLSAVSDRQQEDLLQVRESSRRLRADNRRLADELAATEAALARAGDPAEAERLRQRVGELRDALRAERQENAELRQQLREAGDTDALERRIASLEQELAEARRGDTQARADLKQAQATIDQKNTRISNLTERIDRLQDKVQRLQERRDADAARLAQLEAEVADLRSENARLAQVDREERREGDAGRRGPTARR